MGEGQYVDPFPELRGASIGRREHAPLRIEPHLGQVSENCSKPSSNKEARHVLQEDESRSHVANDAGDVRPDPPLVVEAPSLARRAPRLAGEAGGDHPDTTEQRGVQVGEVSAPDRSRCQGLVLHPRQEDGRRVGFPLNVSHHS